MSRSSLMKLHVLLAVFLLPVTIMFFVTGALYIWDIKGAEEKITHTINIEPSFSGEIAEFVLLTKNKLNILGLSEPTGKPKMKEKGSVFEWPGSAVEVKIKMNTDMLVAQMEVKKAGWYRHLVQLHKAKGGFLFKLYATLLSFALLTILLTGFVMAWQMPKLRRLTLITTVSGFLVFLLLVVYS